ncbi:TIGR03088 family PEP-CTERM/XrtA system glycosyltransferase [Thalassotalea euphylliae]|uniref:TIGR03088 family PEP-CTERM/XrtA system glycosyltransferase n=1 Tax=Thalassotalea euphylliae TaxID=1655234 RepID=A0A3E0U3K0_9GAMM|nr:TIGR03088 family PEP-CTERM/XrtA system glycosyltransferase [Thalassotalea euphylliae]REL31143.1 TIGR03088 family PEP-CTERM/XrtA system glycosyltransferase [Thalassotalea euphylliae]
MSQPQIHIAHIVYSFATGGLENGVVNLINHLPENDYRHSIICISKHEPKFFSRIKTNNVRVYDLHKKPGKGIAWLVACWRLLKKIKPDICHSRNLNPLEAQIAAWFAGVSVRIHGEHGWDVNDLNGGNKKNQLIKKLFKLFVHRYVALSKESLSYLEHQINVPANKLTHICNGVDVEKFSHDTKGDDFGFSTTSTRNFVFGTVGRQVRVKNHQQLLDAFIKLKQSDIPNAQLAKLLIVGDGVLKDSLIAAAQQSEYYEDICFTGHRDDIPQTMAAMDVFVLPSLAEGISNTILEAMASGLPVIATNVGGNPDLIMAEHHNSHLVEVNDVTALSNSMAQYLIHQERLEIDSIKVREHCVKHFSIESMVTKYHDLYTSLYQQKVSGRGKTCAA